MTSLTSTSLKGNWSTLLLATGKDGRMDWARLEDEIDALIASEPCGIYSNGTACEFYSHDRDE